MNVNEKLAVITALEKWLKDQKAEIRREADAAFAELCEEHNTEKIGLTINGQKVGQYIMQFHPEGYNVTDKDAFEDFALTYGLASIKRSIRPEMTGAAIKVIEGAVDPEHVGDFVKEEVVLAGDWEEKLVMVGGRVLFADSGLEVPGVAFRPRAMKGTQVRDCKPEVVIPILQGMPGGVNSLLLGGE